MRRARLDDVPIDELAPFVPMAELRRQMDWQFDESVTAIGPPDRGKTTILTELLDDRRNVAALFTKPRDKNARALMIEHGYRIVEAPAQLVIPSTAIARKFVYWPKAASLTDTGAQRYAVERFLAQIWREGNRALFLDEVHYLVEMLHQGRAVKMMLTQGRTNGVAVVAGFQRPAWVPRDVYSSAKHLIIFGTNDETDIKALGGVGGMSAMKIRRVVEYLGTAEADPHEFAYVGTRNGVLLRSRLMK